MSTTATPTPIELLAPARDIAVGRAAILHGADAVYIGADSHGARAKAANSADDIARLADFAHQYHARVYVTLNTLVYDSELSQVEHLIRRLWQAGVDALIVQDLGILRLDIPPIALHASTQCDIRTPQKARWLESLGFSQLVLPRELSLGEIQAIRQATRVPLEAFVHGALCVSYSGDCQAGQVLCGRSANRGECPQVCRFRFDLEDSRGNTLVRGRHLLSLRDMNRLDSLGQMLQGGISSLKIEGRLKDEMYVKNAVAAYRRALDSIISANPDRWQRSSLGTTATTFTPRLDDGFNRGFTNYFLSGTPGAMASLDTPKSIGQPIGKVLRPTERRTLLANLTQPVANGDGLGFFTPDGTFSGFRLNRVDGNILHTATDVNPPRGTTLYRNFNKQKADELAGSTATRLIDIDVALTATATSLTASATICGTRLTASATIDQTDTQSLFDVAKMPQAEPRRRIMAKLGDTPFALHSLADNLAPAVFVPASTLADLRRRLVEALTHTLAATHPLDLRKPLAAIPPLPAEQTISRHDNIANHLAAQVYADAMAARGESVDSTSLPQAIEVAPPTHGEVRVMQTRYCLRRELGACLKTPEGRRMPSPLFLTSQGNRWRVDFNCARCGMDIVALPTGRPKPNS